MKRLKVPAYVLLQWCHTCTIGREGAVLLTHNQHHYALCRTLSAHCKIALEDASGGRVVGEGLG